MIKYSGLSTIPAGTAEDNLVKGCLALEGGAFRGVYTSGVLDALMISGIDLSCTVGVSAGALNGYNYVAGQIGRSGRMNLGQRHNKEYVGLRNYMTCGGIIGFDYMFEKYVKIEPLNEERFNSPDRNFIAVATRLDLGTPVYFCKETLSSTIHNNLYCPDINTAVQASASMPFISRQVMVEGMAKEGDEPVSLPCLDGGCSVNTPYDWGLKEGFGKIVVVRTRTREYRKTENSSLKPMSDIVYHKYPKFKETLINKIDRYNRECEEMNRLEKEGRIFVLAPKEEIGVGRLEKDMELIGRLYWNGYNETMERIDALREYLCLSFNPESSTVSI